MTSEMVQSIGRQYTMRVKDFFNGLLKVLSGRITKMLRFGCYSLYSLAMTLFLSSTRNVEACSCSFPGPVDGAFAYADAVILGELVDEQPDFQPVYPLIPRPNYRPPDRSLTFRVIASWKGVTGTKVGLVTEAGGSFASCGFFGDIGEEYLLYATKASYSEELWVSLCSFRRGKSAENEIAALDAIVGRIQLTQGADPSFPPDVSIRGLCGAGLFPAFGPSLLGLLALRCHCSFRRRSADPR